MSVQEIFKTLINQNPEFSDILKELETLYCEKLWNQLTLKIMELSKDKNFLLKIDVVGFYNDIVLNFAQKMNQLYLTQIAFDVSKTITDLKERLNFCKALVDTPSLKESQEATIISLSLVAELEVMNGQISEASERLDATEKIVESLQIIDSIVHAAYFRARALLYKSKDDTYKFYTNGLQYLAYAQIEQVDPVDRANLAFDLGISALISNDIYNFSDLVENQILQALNGTENQWLAEIILTFNEGKICKWQVLSEKYSVQLNRYLKGFEGLLNQKISTLAVIEFIFGKNSSERVISFEEISQVSHTPIENVENLLMRALSLGLLKGKIDQVSQKITINWVQPRVLTISQINGMMNRLSDWKKTVQNILTLVEGQITPELIS